MRQRRIEPDRHNVTRAVADLFTVLGMSLVGWVVVIWAATS